MDEESADGVQHVSVDKLDAQSVRPRHGDHRLDRPRRRHRRAVTTHVGRRRRAGRRRLAAHRHRAPLRAAPASARLRHHRHLEADLQHNSAMITGITPLKSASDDWCQSSGGARAVRWFVALLTFKVRSTSTSSYLRRLTQDRQHSHNLRDRPLRRCVNLPRRRLLRSAHATVWNSLPKTVVNSDSVTVFKYRLKTPLFSCAFSLAVSQ